MKSKSREFSGDNYVAFIDNQFLAVVHLIMNSEIESQIYWSTGDQVVVQVLSVIADKMWEDCYMHKKRRMHEGNSNR